MKFNSKTDKEENNFVFTDFIDFKKYIEFKYEPAFQFSDLANSSSDNWGFRFNTIADNRIHLSLPGSGGMASAIAANHSFGDYLWKLSDEKESVTRTFYDTEFEFTDINELKTVLDYSLSNIPSCYSMSQGINFYHEADFNDFKEDLLNNDKCPQIVKSLVESVTFDSTRGKKFCLRFDENKVISFNAYKNKNGVEYLHMYYQFLCNR